MYCFPPFSLIWKALSKIRKESLRALLITPLWSTRSCFPMILQNVTKTPTTFSSQHLQLPGTNNKHPLCPELKLVTFLSSNSTSEHKTYLTQQRKLFWPHGEQQLKKDTTQHIRNGTNFEVRKTLITFNQLQMMLSLSFHCYSIRDKVIVHL